MRPSISHSPRRRAAGYTLIEALVAGVVLMIGISAASRLTLTLLTQDEMNQRASTVLNYAETAARLYQMGLSEADIRGIVPADPVVDSITFTALTPTYSGSTATLAAAGGLEPMSIAVTFHPNPATQSWTGHIWTSGNKDAVRTVTVVAYRNTLSTTIN